MSKVFNEKSLDIKIINYNSEKSLDILDTIDNIYKYLNIHKDNPDVIDSIYNIIKILSIIRCRNTYITIISMNMFN